MSAEVLSKMTIGLLALTICSSVCGAQTTSSTLSVVPDTMFFGDHDIGTSTTKSLTATNFGDVPTELMVSLAGETAGEYSWSSKCVGILLATKSCQITVAFSPVAIGKDKGDGEDRRAILSLSNDRGEHKEIQLSGRAFQNVNISPSVLEFETQTGSASNVTKTVQLTNYTNSTVNNITIAITGDFTENHAGCSTPLAPGGSCEILVTFSSKQSGAASGSLTVTANPSIGRLPRTVSLLGRALNRCVVPRFSWRSWSLWLVLIIIGLYFLGLVLVRWHMIAKPARAQLIAQIETVRSRAVAESAGRPDSPELSERLQRIHFLLDFAEYPFKYRQFPINPATQGRRVPALPVVPPWHTGLTRFFNALFWTRGQELAGWSLSHEAELQSVDLLRTEAVRARLELAEEQIRTMKTPFAAPFADRIRESLTSGEELLAERARQLLQQFQQLVKQTSVPVAAREAWLADLRQRLSNSLQQFIGWAQNNTDEAKTTDERSSQFQGLSKIAPTFVALNGDLGKVPDTSSLPSQSGSLLKESAAFLSRLTNAIQQIPNPDDQATILDDYNKSLSKVVDLRSDAEALSEKLKSLPPADQAKIYQSLLDLCKSQASLMSLITQATTPSPAGALLKELFIAVQDQEQLVKRINQAVADGSANDFGNCRDLVLTLANLPPLPADLTGRINSLLLGEAPAPLARWKALLVEALGLIYEDTDNDFSQLASWHNKMMWLVGCALLFMFALAVTFGNAVLLLLGAVGGLLSRLTRTTAAADVPNDYGATWGSLFLSPLTGALSAWGGILLILLGLKLNVLGTALNLDWCNPYAPVALAIALLFGFSERLFDSVTDQLQEKLLKSPPPAPTTSTPPPAPPAPMITSVSPASPPTAGKEVELTVRGANFQQGATASLTRDTGDPSPAKVEFKTSSLVVVTCTPSGVEPFTATLTIANPDKQVVTAKLDVAHA
jgi:hypothetical protein